MTTTVINVDTSFFAEFPTKEAAENYAKQFCTERPEYVWSWDRDGDIALYTVSKPHD